MELHPGQVERHVSEDSLVELDPIRRALQENEDWYRDLVEHSHDLLCIHDLQGRLLSVNPSPARVLGYTVEELIQIPMREIIAPEFRPQFDAYLVEVGSKGQASGLMAVMTRAGERRVWEYHNTLRTEGVASPIVRGMGHDITERIQARNALQSSEKHFRMLIEQASDGIFVSDSEGKYLDVNSAGAEMLGYSREEILQRTIADVIAGDEIPHIKPEVDRLADGTINRREWCFRRKDGSLFIGEVTARQLPDGRLQGILRDMSDRRRAEEAIRTREARFRSLVRACSQIVWTTPASGKQSGEGNREWQTFTGQSAQETVGDGWADAIHREDRERTVEAWHQAVTAETMFEIEHRVRRSDGAYRYMLVRAVPVFDHHGKVVEWVGMHSDITERKQVEEELRQAKEKLTEERLYLEREIHSELGFGEIIGQSHALRAVMEQVDNVASSDATVLLLGETGTGKELIARAIHEKSTRKGNSFIKVNCAAIPSGLLESELFGHEKGAFTGAITRKVGRLELADKGTLFLDEIGEIPLALQPKLLRVLQDQEFERLGGTHTLKVNFRLIAATNRDLSESIKEKQFRTDLYYRLNVFPVRVPPLRERREDIRLLAEHFVQLSASRMNRSITSIPKKTMEILIRWNWPGNVRELENFIERSVILTLGSVLAAPINELPINREAGDDSLKAREREHILRALEQSRGQLSGPRGAAARLGLPRSTLQWKLKQMGINHAQYRD